MERMVTRTINSTVFEVMVCEIKDMEVSTIEVRLSGDWTEINTEKCMKEIRKHYENERVKPVAIQSKRLEQELYGMPEADFIKLAQILRPRGTKAE